MKKMYENPQTNIVVLNVNSEFLDGGEIYQGTNEKPFDDAKEQDDVVQDDEPDLAAPIKDKWEDMSEKKIAK